MKLTRLVALASTAAFVGVAWMAVGMQSTAVAQDVEIDMTGRDTHTACVSNDIDAMPGAMESMNDEDWDSMEFHMGLGMMSPELMGPAMGMVAW